MATKNEFKHKYLTMRISATERGLQFHPKWVAGDCEMDTECKICSDGCTNCSGDCTKCTATCRGADSTGALLPNPQGDVELVLDLEAIAKVLEAAQKAVR